jgi:ComF family protein
MENIFDYFLPKQCLECNIQGSYICKVCLERVPLAKQICPVCKKYSLEGRAHKFCKGSDTLDGLYSIWCYRGIVRKALITTKYKYVYQVIKELSSQASIEIKKFKILNNKRVVLVPIPARKDRVNWRGFNQTNIITRVISKDLGLKTNERLLIKTGKNPPQTGLSKENRQKNIKDTFRVNRNIKVDKNALLVIVDDVWTTGSTINEVTRTLKENGFDKIWGIVLSR